jgi:DNA-binding HxlR family transcriptional regulator
MSQNRCGCCTTGDSPATVSEPTCYCPVDELLEVVSKKYALSIVGLLANSGPRRHSEIAAELDVTSSSVLTDRLQELTAAGLVERTSYDQVPPHVEYSLSPGGREFERRLRPLLQWQTRRSSDAE